MFARYQGWVASLVSPTGQVHWQGAGQGHMTGAASIQIRRLVLYLDTFVNPQASLFASLPFIFVRDNLAAFLNLNTQNLNKSSPQTT